MDNLLQQLLKALLQRQGFQQEPSLTNLGYSSQNLLPLPQPVQKAITGGGNFLTNLGERAIRTPIAIGQGMALASPFGGLITNDPERSRRFSEDLANNLQFILSGKRLPNDNWGQ